MDAELRISYNFHGAQDILLGLVFSITSKYKTYSRLVSHTKTGGGPDLAHGPSFTKPCPRPTPQGTLGTCEFYRCVSQKGRAIALGSQSRA